MKRLFALAALLSALTLAPSSLPPAPEGKPTCTAPLKPVWTCVGSFCFWTCGK